MKITDARNNSIKLGKLNKILNRSEFYKFDLVVSGPCQQITQPFSVCSVSTMKLFDFFLFVCFLERSREQYFFLPITLSET